ncbi:MAG: histidine triad nucleotide-binding protein [Pirellulaceae bacterium]
MTDQRTIFKKIIDGDIPAERVYEDELCLAFHDITPQAPVHVLLIPKKEIRNMDGVGNEDQALIGHMLCKVKEIAAKLNLGQGYRLVANCGQDGGQSVDHLHFHILGGRQLKWPPG